VRFRRAEAAALCAASLLFLISFYAYPNLPDQVASHWNVRGEADMYLPKFWGAFLLPMASVPLTLLLIAIPRIDPLKANIEAFRRYYDAFIALFSAFLLAVHAHVILWNLGVRVNPLTLYPILIGILFFYIGVLCENSKRNWFIGIRTPWTLSSDRVWEKTHKIGGKLFKASGIMMLLCPLLPPELFPAIVLFIALLTAAYTVTFSYFEYQKEAKAGK